MSKYTLRKSINRAFTSSLVDNFIARQQEEKKIIEYTLAQEEALNNKDFEKAESIEKKISGLLTDKIQSLW